MSDIAFSHMDRMESLVYELQQHSQLMEHSKRVAKDLMKRYQAGIIPYKNYSESLLKIHDGKERAEWYAEQRNIMSWILDQIDFFNKQVFFRVYSEKEVVHVILDNNQKAKHTKREAKKADANTHPEVEPKKKPEEKPKAVEETDEDVGGLDELFEELEK